MAADPRYADIAARTRNIESLYAFLAQTFATRTTAEWLRLLGEADIPIIAMNTPATLLEDPHMREVGFFAEEAHPSEGPIRTIGIPQEWSETRPQQRYPAPRLGEHSAQLLSEYGFGADEIQAIVRSGACGVTADPAREEVNRGG